MKSTTPEIEKEIETSVGEEQPQSTRARRPSDRHAKSGKWVESLRSSDVGSLWKELHRVVSHHPLVRASRSAGLLVEEGATTAYTDLTQELFVQLLSKNRFEHYLDSEMTDYEVECEISQIELTNLLTSELESVTRKAIVLLAAFLLSFNPAQTSDALIPAASTMSHIDAWLIEFMV